MYSSQIELIVRQTGMKSNFSVTFGRQKEKPALFWRAHTANPLISMKCVPKVHRRIFHFHFIKFSVILINLSLNRIYFSYLLLCFYIICSRRNVTLNNLVGCNYSQPNSLDRLTATSNSWKGNCYEFSESTARWVNE